MINVARMLIFTSPLLAVRDMVGYYLRNAYVREELWNLGETGAWATLLYHFHALLRMISGDFLQPSHLCNKRTNS